VNDPQGFERVVAPWKWLPLAFKKGCKKILVGERECGDERGSGQVMSDGIEYVQRRIENNQSRIE
jgi:hypothetical protein